MSLAGGLWALARGRGATAGVLLACAGWLRIFPLVVYGALLLRDLAGPGWRERLRGARCLHAAFAAASLAILALTSTAEAPGGRNPWLAFAENLGMHASAVGTNQVFLAVPIGYSAQREELAVSDGAGGGDAAARGRAARAGWAWLAALPLLALAAAALRHAPGAAALLPALLAIFCVLPVTHYDWLALSALALVVRERPWLQWALPALFVALATGGVRDLSTSGSDPRFALMSVWVGLFLVGSCAALWHRGRSAAAPARPRSDPGTSRRASDRA